MVVIPAVILSFAVVSLLSRYRGEMKWRLIEMERKRKFEKSCRRWHIPPVTSERSDVGKMGTRCMYRWKYRSMAKMYWPKSHSHRILTVVPSFISEAVPSVHCLVVGV